MAKSIVIYLATAYNHAEAEVREQRYRRAVEYTTALLNMGAFVYSPIVHNHPIAITGDLGRDFSFWEGFDYAMIDRCDILAVAQIEGWKKSVGIAAELKYARENHIPVQFLPDPLTPESIDHLTFIALNVVSKARVSLDKLEGGLTLAEIAKVNLERALLWHGDAGLEQWSVSDWAVAMAGECGEICDAVKKLRRIECAVESNNARQPINKEAAVRAIAQEIGDTFVYLDLLAQRLGLTTEDCIRDTFNRISIRENMPQRL